MQPLDRKLWSGSGPNPSRSLREEGQREAESGAAIWRLGGQSERHRERNLEVELNMMQFELFSLKQKMENSFALLEREKKWLETSFLENRKQEGDLDEKIFKVEMELAKTQSYLGESNRKSLPPAAINSGTNGVAEEKSVDEELAAHKKRIKALERRRSEVERQLKSTKEEHQRMVTNLAEAEQRAKDSLQAKEILCEEKDRLQTAHDNIYLEKTRLEEKVHELNLELQPALSDRKRLLEEKVALHQQVERLTLELECTQKQQEGFQDQVSALSLELSDAKSQVRYLDKEKVLMKEELESTRKAKEELLSEKKILENRIQALQDERLHLLDERKTIHSENQADGKKQEEKTKALQESYENLRESLALQQREKELLQTRCQELEAALHNKQKETENQFAEQKQVSLYWKERWEEAAAALKAKDEELEVIRTQSQALSAKGPGAKAIRSPQQEQESLKLQHQLVTEQLKGIFRQRAQQKQGTRKPPGRLQESSAMSPTSQGTLVGAASLKFSEEGETGSQDIEVESLRQQLKQKMEMISSMTSEIEALKQKNENLTKGKLRFQQQIQEIRRLSKQQPEKSTPDLPVPRLADKLSLDFQSAKRSGSSLPSPQSDEPTITLYGQEKRMALQHPSLVTADDTNARHLSLAGPAVHDSPTSVAHLQLRPDVPDISVPSISLPLDEFASLQEAQSSSEGDGALLRPQSPALLSPRPFGLPRPWSPVKSRASPELSDN
ncbi:myosin heavy chain, clone 203 isoform X2 [Anolis carolinensis]|uniref:myosin heavy chain, clone 203 isoform X2 n=1 Tax=Anolis carolinensis TaxID=28377 RepID=UPI0002C88B79|nr:PREDICTED: myosin heavy chain, clone 203 isoform X2 [Anolis carolinensis]|eukprot:XP_016853668.1 PREDICTED: myosin heavy chain, clone 203 isoform X2 [Anolis carolinensis]